MVWLSVALFVGFGVLGFVVVTVWRRRRHRRTFTHIVPPMDASNTTFLEDEQMDAVARLAALGAVDLLVYYTDPETYERRLFLRVPVDTLDSLAVLAPDLLVVIAQGEYPTIPKTRPGVGVVVLQPGTELHIAVERRE